MTDVLMVDLVGPGYSFSTIERGGLGGSELEVLQIAGELTRRGHKVAVVNRHDRAAFVENDVTFAPPSQIRQFLPKRALYLERMSAVDFGGPPPAGGTIVVRATDVACEPYLAHKPLLESGRATLVGVSRWQLEESGADRRGFWYAKDRQVVAPILDPTPSADRVPHRFVYASNPCKGLQQTVEHWLDLRSKYDLPGATLVLVLPGYVDGQTQQLPIDLTPEMVAAGISYAGAPTPSEYRRQIAMSEGLFFVNTMTETFGNVAAIAERAGVRTHILCRGEIGGLREALVDSSFVTRDAEKFEGDFLQNFGHVSAHKLQVPDRSAEAMGAAWEKVLRLERGAAAVVTSKRAGTHVGHYPSHEGDAARLYWAHDRVLVGGSITPECAAELRALGVTHVLSAEHEHDDAGMWPDDRRLRVPFPDDGQSLEKERNGAPAPDLRAAIAYARRVLADPNAVLYCHCRLGGSRGPSMAYLALRAHGLSAEDAMQAIRQTRDPGWRPHSTYIDSIERALALEQDASPKSVESTFAIEDLPKNRDDLPPLFGKWLSLQRKAIAPGGSEMGLALGLFFLAAATRAETIVEIGRFKGFSTLALAAGMELVHGVGWQETRMAEQRPDVDYGKLLRSPKQPVIWSIDPSPMPEADELLASAGLAHHVRRVDHKSTEVDVEKPIDLLFIDGDHSLEGVKADIRRFVPKVRAGGYFALHDYFGWWGPGGENGSPIKAAIEELLPPEFERVLIDTGFASFVIFRKTADVLAALEPLPPRGDGRPTVGLVMITRNEGHVIARALMSASKVGLDHMMVFVDERTTDATAEIAGKMGAEVFMRPAASITDARNDAIRIAEQRTDYLVVLDPDDTLEGHVDPKIGGADAYQFNIQDHGNSYPRLQMFRGKRGFRYEGVRHETLMPPKDREVNLAVQSTLIYRRVGGGSWQDQFPPKEKYLTHAKDLEKHIIDNPTDTRSIFYLAQSYMDAGEHDLARQYYERRIRMGGFAEEVYASHMMLARIDERTGADPVPNLLRAFESAPHRAEPLVYAAVWLRDEKRKRYALAYALASRACSMPMPPAGSFFIDPAVYKWQALCETGIAAFFSGQYQAALDAFTEADKRVPAEDAELRGFTSKNIAVCKAKLAEVGASKVAA